MYGQFRFRQKIDSKAPVYVIFPPRRDTAEVRLGARIKKARIRFRSFEPDDVVRLSGVTAIADVAASHGIVATILPSERAGHVVHNLRCAFVAGLARGLDRHLLLLQFGNTPIPLDVRDFASIFTQLDQIDAYVSEFASAIVERLLAADTVALPSTATFLSRLTLGSSTAENEETDLQYYYHETDEYRRALKGEGQVIAGRKGSGKTALFTRIRDTYRRKKANVVLDLRPEGYQLLKFKERVLDYLDTGTRDHTITVFWEYLIYLEICHKLLEKDKEQHIRDHTIYEDYCNLSALYGHDDYVSEGDFAERLLQLTGNISSDFEFRYDTADDSYRLNMSEISEFLYKHDVPRLRKQVLNYLQHKESVWILFDNLDKGWPADGVKREDILLIRTLIEALRKIEREVRKSDGECHSFVFIRTDVYDLLVHSIADHGKIACIPIDWSDADALREVLRRRFVFAGVDGDASFDAIWPQIVASHVNGEESSQYLIDRCLMRPRALIELFNQCRSHAVNLGHTRIEEGDVLKGEERYSLDLISKFCVEIRDVDGTLVEILYAFIEATRRLSAGEVRERLASFDVSADRMDRVVELFLWYGFLGLVRDNGESQYIYDVGYDKRHLLAVIARKAGGSVVYEINPAFWKGLEISG